LILKHFETDDKATMPGDLATAVFSNMPDGLAIHRDASPHSRNPVWAVSAATT
jgi:hypothetical protein